MDQGGRIHRLRENRKEISHSFLLSPSNYSLTYRFRVRPSPASSARRTRKLFRGGWKGLGVPTMFLTAHTYGEEEGASMTRLRGEDEGVSKTRPLLNAARQIIPVANGAVPFRNGRGPLLLPRARTRIRQHTHIHVTTHTHTNTHTRTHARTHTHTRGPRTLAPWSMCKRSRLFIQPLARRRT